MFCGTSWNFDDAQVFSTGETLRSNKPSILGLFELSLHNTILTYSQVYNSPFFGRSLELWAPSPEESLVRFVHCENRRIWGIESSMKAVNECFSHLTDSFGGTLNLGMEDQFSNSLQGQSLGRITDADSAARAT